MARLTGSVHASDAGPGGTAPDVPWSVGRLEEIYDSWSRADDRLVWVIEDQHLHRVGLEVYAFNPRARRVYEKAGFVLEGTMREALLFDDQWIDCHVMGLLAPEWRRLQAVDQPSTNR